MNECACVYVDTNYDLPSFHRAKLQIARKEHACCECRRTISLGEKYEYVTGLWEGRFDVFKTCADCLSIRRQFFCDGWQYLGMKEMLWEHLQEQDGDVSEDCLNIFSYLTPKAREIVCEMIEEIWWE